MSIVKKAEKIVGESVYYVGNSVWISCNFAEASAPISVAWSKDDALDGRFDTTPFQCADARHSPMAAGRMVREWGDSQG